ncbi:hypothetical protein Z959_08175 [Clostridium novyi B str. ATCC 27606]|uniref:Uncharacterized protein n=1 Tax=Clostridium novyi B str. ATCC 27606 TaxID=1443123 RepID=A0AA40IUQ1_CLONO|nr:hypothetical protein [Clostridium novyi]KEI16960.1 hypothetical protein Z959_08175 [Clostridium novyi B str. ATCC 27606]
MLSDKLSVAMSNFIEAAEKQEDLIREKDKDIQTIVSEIERALREPTIYKDILSNIVEEYKQAL